jgi:hypothetical protein
MPLTRDTAKKMYQNVKNYPDSMRQISNKFIWNKVLNKYPRLAEFFLTGRGKRELTTIERSLAEFIRQSEFVKPYKPVPYQESEYSWDPKGGSSGEYGAGPSIPTAQVPPEDSEEIEPGVYVCWAKLNNGCFCKYGEQYLDIEGSYPIENLEITAGFGYLKNTTGLGHTNVRTTYVGNEKDFGMVTIEVYMFKPNGDICDSNVNVFECSDEICCEAEPTCSEDNPETISQSSEAELVWVGGTPRFNFEITEGTGFWLNQGFSITQINLPFPQVKIYTDATACGTATVEMRDDCDQTASCQIRCTTGVWTRVPAAPGTPGPCGCKGPADGRPFGWCGNATLCNHISGKCRQRVQYGQGVGCYGSCNCFPIKKCNRCDEQDRLGGFGECIPFGDCGGAYVRGATSNSICCYYPCTTPDDEDQAYDALECYGYTAGFPYYQEWDCA